MFDYQDNFHKNLQSTEMKKKIDIVDKNNEKIELTSQPISPDYM